jgi:hypothetical protein
MMTASGDLLNGLEELAEATPGYLQAQAYYEATNPEVFASARLRWAMQRSGIAYRLNFAATAVDAVVERLRITSVTSPDHNANEQLQGIWRRNKMGLQMRQILRRASEYGDAYVMVWPSGDPDDGDGDFDVDIFYNSPTCVRVIYDEANPLRKRYAIKRWEEGKRIRVDLLYPDVIQKWISKPETKGNHAVDWMPYVDSFDLDPETNEVVEVWPVENPFGEIPVFHFRNDQPYGRPEHKGFYGPQDAIHKLAVSHMSGVDYQAFPQRYALADGGSSASDAADVDEDMFAIADTGTGSTRSAAGEGKANLSADPGSVWWMTGVREMGQFSPSDHGNFTEPMMIYLRFGAEITNTPLHRVDPTGDAPSGESLRASEAPFAAKVEDRILYYSDTVEELFGFALRVSGFQTDIDVQWAPVQTLDDVEGWNTVMLKLQAGVDPKQVLTEAGYSEELVDEWLAAKPKAPPALPAPPVPAALPPVPPAPQQ